MLLKYIKTKGNQSGPLSYFNGCIILLLYMGWMFALKRKGIKPSHIKTEYLHVNKREATGTVTLLEGIW